MISTLKNQHTEKDKPTLSLKYVELEILHDHGVLWPLLAIRNDFLTEFNL